MIYILAGNSAKEKTSYIKKLVGKGEVVKLAQAQASKELVKNYAENVSLFGDLPTVIIESGLSLEFSTEELKGLSESKTVFIFNEDKLLKADEKKYIKYATIEHFDEKEVKAKPAINTFAIADAYARRDKVNTWILYREAVDAGLEPEMISGMLFWKLKTMVQSGNRNFSPDELKHNASSIVSLYHEAHRGERDFVIGLEQFILSTLSK